MQDLFPELTEREKAYYTAKGRLYEAYVVYEGAPPLPAELQTDNGYIALALQIQQMKEDSQE